MALLDFLGQPVGGYNYPVNDPGGLGVSQGSPATGLTWGQLFAGLDTGKKAEGVAPTAPIAGQQQQKNTTAGDIASIMKIFGALFGV